jgi:hypothetical protein
MTYLRLLKTFSLIVCSAIALATISYGQGAQSGRGGSKAAGPVTMTECEGTNNCATWTFLGTQGNGQWPSGEIANLSVDHFDDNSVVIHRADSTGSSAGLTVTYTGTRHGDRIGGEFTSSWPGHWTNKPGNWYATIGKTPQALPTVMRNCDYPRYNYCATMTWNKDHYDFIASNGNTGKYFVISFTQDTLVLRGTMDSLPNYTSISTGKISPDGNRILAGDVSDTLGRTSHFTASWGAALEDVPAVAVPGPVQRPVWPVVVCYPWFFGIVCQ